MARERPLGILQLRGLAALRVDYSRWLTDIGGFTYANFEGFIRQEAATRYKVR